MAIDLPSRCYAVNKTHAPGGARPDNPGLLDKKSYVYYTSNAVSFTATPAISAVSLVVCPHLLQLIAGKKKETISSMNKGKFDLSYVVGRVVHCTCSRAAANLKLR